RRCRAVKQLEDALVKMPELRMTGRHAHGLRLRRRAVDIDAEHPEHLAAYRDAAMRRADNQDDLPPLARDLPDPAASRALPDQGRGRDDAVVHSPVLHFSPGSPRAGASSTLLTALSAT